MTTWCILRCSGRSTLPLADSLSRDGYEVYAPVAVRTVIIPRLNVKRKVRLPILPEFVFAREHHLLDLLELERIRPGFWVMIHNGAPARTPDSQLDPLRKAEHMVEPKRWTSAFAKGSRVTITKGSAKGLTGMVESCNGKEAELWVSLFGRHHRMKISTFNLQPDKVDRFRSDTDPAALAA